MNGASIRLPRLVLLALVSWVLATALSTTVASAQYCTPDQCDECNLCRSSQNYCHEVPELWLINSRSAPRCQNLDSGFDCISFKRYDRQCGRWVQESVESFLAEEATMPTLFYAHGNSLSHKFAMKSCWLIYQKMRCCPGPKRLVFWSWPSERVFKTERLRVRKMIEKNLRTKYKYAEYQGYYLAKLVNQMSLSQRVMLAGHSYGGIASAAALHYMGGGCLRGLTLDGGAEIERPNLRAAVISGAFDHDMLIPGHRYGQAFVAGEKIFVTRNINDRTLRRWPKTSWTGRRAIGVVGVNANHLGEYRHKLCQQTMSADVGTSHYLKPHLRSGRFVSALCCLSFPSCQQNFVAKVEKRIESENYLEMPNDGEHFAAEARWILNSSIALDGAGDDASDNVGDGAGPEFDNLSLLAEDYSTEVLESEAFVSEDQSPTFAELESLAAPSNKTAQEVSSPQEDESAGSTEPQPAEKAMQLAGHTSVGQAPLRYRIGLILAMLLTSQIYVLLGNRGSSA